MIHQIFPTLISLTNHASVLAEAKQAVDTAESITIRDNKEVVHEEKDENPCKQYASYLQARYPNLTATVLHESEKLAKAVYNIKQHDYLHIKYAWVMKYTKGSSVFPHQHMSDNIKISAVYYTHIGSDCSPIRFYDQKYFTSDCTQKGLTYDVYPNEGDLVVYPAHIVHSVPANNSLDRCCIVFDISLIRL